VNDDCSAVFGGARTFCLDMVFVFITGTKVMAAFFSRAHFTGDRMPERGCSK
jgi:hypothetical protein